MEVKTFIQGYNKKLRDVLVLHYLNQEFRPKATFVYANSNDIVMGIVLIIVTTVSF